MIKRPRQGGQPTPPTIVNTCVVCGIQFVGKRPYQAYSGCGKPECRLEIMKRAGKKSWQKQKDRRQEKGHWHECNVCGREFLAESRFIRTCPACKANRDDHPVYAEVWGATI